MNIHFFKYEGAGNDFILIDAQDVNPLSRFPEPEKLIAFLCNRHFGIGADGLILLLSGSGHDFEMRYYNSDGFVGSMCGNGGRCMVAFANHLRIIENKTTFIAADGLHSAEILNQTNNFTLVSLGMNDVETITPIGEDLFLDTGSPHLVKFVDDLDKIDVFTMGRKIRYSPPFNEKGTNVNFAQISENSIRIRTYERGVENETLACGTGITATAIAAYYKGFKQPDNIYDIRARGGNLKVGFTTLEAGKFSEIYLEGPASLVFEGNIFINPTRIESLNKL